MSIRCWLGWHGYIVRDQTIDGRQVLRCLRCWRMREYPPVNADAVAAWRSAQLEQARHLALKASWRGKVT